MQSKAILMYGCRCLLGVSLVTASQAAHATDISGSLSSTLLPDTQMLLSQLAQLPLPQQSALPSKPKTNNLFLLPSDDRDILGNRFGWIEGNDVQYAIFRSPGDVYFKGRAGYLTDYTRESFEDISIGEIVNEFDKHGALGLGAGYTLKNGNKLEFDYTVTKEAEQILQVEYLF